MKHHVHKLIIFLSIAAMLAACMPSASVFAAQPADADDCDLSELCGLETIILDPVEWTLEEAEENLNLDSESETVYDRKMSGAEYNYWMKFSNDYYYDQLDETEQTLWRELEEICVSYVTGTDSDKELYSKETFLYATEYSAEDVTNFLQMFCYAHPQFYFLSNQYGYYKYTQGNVTWYVPRLVVYDAVTDGDARADATSQFCETVDAWVEEVSAYSEVETETLEKAAHDIICENTVYSANAWDQSAYSVACVGKSVCAGYTAAFQMLMNAVGIETIEVTSSNHAWNMVNIHGIWYETDTTWDDGSGSTIYYSYYNKSAETVVAKDSDHALDAMWTGYLPEADYDSFTGQTYQDAYFWKGNYEYFIINSNTSLGNMLAGAVDTKNNAWFAAVPDTVKDGDGNTYTTVDLYEDETLELDDVVMGSLESTSSGVQVSWNAVVNASSYNVYRRVSGGSWVRLASGVTATTYMDTTAVDGTTYYYTVRAVNGSIMSAGYDVTKSETYKKTAVDTTKNGMLKDSDGVWRYYKNGIVDTSYTGLAKNKYGTWYIKNGVLDRTYTGMCKYNGEWVYVAAGKQSTTYTGMAKNKYGWWYMKNGKLDLTYTGMAKNSRGWWYMKNGKLDLTYTGMAKNTYGWWYMKNGKLDLTYTGMAKNSHGWWYMKNGKLDLTYTGMAKNSHGWWYMTNGKLDTTYTGIATNKYGSWYMKNGALQKTYSGKVTLNGKTYTIKNGKVV